MPLRRNVVVGICVRRAHRRTAVAGHVPGQAQARCKIPPLLVHAGAIREAGIAGIVQAGWGVFVDGALDSLLETAVVE